MSITLKFFMIKRGFTHEKLVNKAGAQSVDDVLNYVRGLGVAPTPNDIVELETFFAGRQQVTAPDVVVLEEPATVEVAVAPAKSKRKKKSHV